jgi:putative ABC transport system permease protein
MSLILRIFSFINLALRRLAAQFGLALAILFGLVVSISLVLSVPLYADSIYHRALVERVYQSSANAPRHPPFTFAFSFTGSASNSRDWQEIEPVDTFLENKTASTLGLPVRWMERYFVTQMGDLYTSQSGQPLIGESEARLGFANIGTLSDLQDHITLLEGTFPVVASGDSGAIEVLIDLDTANEKGLQTGGTYTLLIGHTDKNGLKTETLLPLRISGVWQPADAGESYWLFNPNLLKSTLLVPQATFTGGLSNRLPGEVYSALWFIIMDPADVQAGLVEGLINRINQLDNQAATIFPEVKSGISPVDDLWAYRRATQSLTVLLYAFAVPVIGLVLAFIGLVTNLSIERKQNEIAVTRSRGAATLTMLGSVALESVILAGLAFAISLPVSVLLTRLMSQMRSFADFAQTLGRGPNGLQALGVAIWNMLSDSSSVPFDRVLDPVTLRLGAAAVVVALLAAVFPALRASRHTIVTYKQERARNMRPPIWQRIYLDFILLIPAAYGTYLMVQQGGIVAISQTQSGGAAMADPLSNPLLFLVPSLVVLTVALLFLRLVPLVMSLISWLALRTRSVGILLAARHLSRSPGTYNTPLVTLIFTLSLSAYTASLAFTLDNHLYDQSYYRVGADAKFTEMGESEVVNSYAPQGNAQSSDTGPEFVFLPVSEYLKIPGVQAATRVGAYDASVQGFSGVYSKGQYLGIDRVDFPQVAFWRRDFARYPLGVLMNSLAAMPNGVLVPNDFLRTYSLQPGDPFTLVVNTSSVLSKLDLVIVGSFDLFPTWYPDEGPLFVGNLDYLYEQAGGEYPYHVWMKLNPGADPELVTGEGLTAINMRAISSDATEPRITAVQLRPERQGVFGLLFIGFAASAILTVLGFLLYAFFSYQRRFIELGILRAGGLSRTQMSVYLAFEMIFLIGMGGLVGTALGLGVSSYFIPFLQVGTDAASRIPPFNVVIGWSSIFQIYGLFIILFLVTFLVLGYMLQRMKIFQAVKLGETV